MSFAPNAVYDEGPQEAPSILVALALDTGEGLKTIGALAKGCRGVKVVRLHPLQAVAIFETGQALELPR